MSTPPATQTAGTVVPTPLLPHLSWSGIESYKMCPKKFEFRYIANAKEERTAASLAFGGSIHRALEEIHQRRMEGRPAPAHAELVDFYQSTWQEAVKDAPEVVFSKDEDAGTLLDLAGRMLAAYLEHLQGEEPGRQTIGIEHEAHFKLVPDSPPIKARVDLVEIVGEALVVTDWKTSKSRWNVAKAAERLGQLVVYSYALLPMLKALEVSRVVPRFVVLTKAKTVKIQVLEPKASQTDAARFKDSVAETWAAVQAGIFPRRESWACSSCPFRTACLGR